MSMRVIEREERNEGIERARKRGGERCRERGERDEREG